MIVNDYQIDLNNLLRKKVKKYQLCLQKSWKKSFDSGVIIPAKMRFCNECSDEKICNNCNNRINENKEFEADIKLLKRKASNELGYMLPYYF